MTRRTVDFHPEAIEEFIAARRWYEQRSLAAKEAFLDELDEAVERIADHPDRWPVHRNNTRRYLLKRFPYAIVYRATNEFVRIIAIAHGRRRPGYWKARG